jgi:hypothetical protein
MIRPADFAVTALEKIVALNRDGAFSETDPLTERRYQQFARRLSPWTRDVLDVRCDKARGIPTMD